METYVKSRLPCKCPLPRQCGGEQCMPLPLTTDNSPFFAKSPFFFLLATLNPLSRFLNMVSQDWHMYL